MRWSQRGEQMTHISIAEAMALLDKQAADEKRKDELKIQSAIEARKRELMPLREELAELAHEQWSGWMKYLFSKGTQNEDGTWTMPAGAVERWTRQRNTPYDDLSDDEQNSDRNEADKFLDGVRPWL